MYVEIQLEIGKLCLVNTDATQINEGCLQKTNKIVYITKPKYNF